MIKMNITIFAWGYILTPEEVQTLQQNISLNDYDYIRNSYLSPLKSGEHLFGIIRASITGDEKSVIANKEYFSFDPCSMEGLKLQQCYRNCVQPFIPEVKNPEPNFVLAILEEES